MEGDITADYLAKQLKTLQPNIPIYRLGTGLPVGGELNYADKSHPQGGVYNQTKSGGGK